MNPPRSTSSDKTLPWGIEEDEMEPNSLGNLTDDKLARFVIGHQTKTKFEKEREEREAKKIKADEEAAAIYAQFVASFEHKENDQGPMFVQAKRDKHSAANTDFAKTTGFSSGTNAFGTQRGTKRAFMTAQEIHLESALSCEEASGGWKRVSKRSEMDKMLEEMKQNDLDRQERKDQYHQQQKQTKRRQIDDFLQEIKEREPLPPNVEEGGLTKGSFDNGDPFTTNLYVGNLAPSMTEQILEEEFGKFGEVYSVKIMWPRTEDERLRRRICGFVSFFTREDADEARVALNNRELNGHEIVVGWGKAVKIDPNARHLRAIRRGNATAHPPTLSTIEPAMSGREERVVVTIPSEERLWKRVDTLATFVAKDGSSFETQLALREASNPDFAFLSESTLPVTKASPLHLYYRWRVYSLAMGDSLSRWREEPFQMSKDGPAWVPPKMPSSAIPVKEPTFKSASRSKSRSERSRHRTQRVSTRRHQNRASSSSGNSRSDSSSRSRSRGRSRSRSRGRSRSRSRSRIRSSSRSRSSSRNQSRSSSRSRSRSSGNSRKQYRGRQRSPNARGRSRDRFDARQNCESRFQESKTRWSKGRDSHSRSPSTSWSRLSSRSSSKSSQSSRKSIGQIRGKRFQSPVRQERSAPAPQEPFQSRNVAASHQMMTGQQLAKARDRERGRDREKLPREKYEEFKSILAACTLDRASIKKAMGFALDHSEYAIDIVQILYKSFQEEEAPAPSNANLAAGNIPANPAVLKVAYFFVASDILHNSSAAVKNASLFRTTFQEYLPCIMDILRSCHRKIAGRMSANAMKEKVLNVLTAWESWSLFPPIFLVGLNATFLRKADEEQAMSSVGEKALVLGESEEEAIRKRCRQSGIVSSGSAAQMLARLRWLKEYTAPQKGPVSTSHGGGSLDAKSLVDQVKRDLDALRKDATIEMAIRSKSAQDTQKNDEDLDGEPLDEQQPSDDHGEEAVESDFDEDLDGEPLDSEDEE